MNCLWYRRPAGCWEEALPLGNGRLGAMVFGEIYRERIQVNEESIWYGGPVDRVNPDAKEAIHKVQRLIEEGRIREAQDLLADSVTACPNGMNPYQTLGDITLYFSHEGLEPFTTLSPDLAFVSPDWDTLDYRRELDLERAVCTVSYQVNGIRYVREHFISAVTDVMTVRLRAADAMTGKPVSGKLSFRARLGRGMYMEGVKKAGENAICLYGGLGEGGNHFLMQLMAQARGGTVCTRGETLVVEQADEVLLLFGADCDYHLQTGEENTMPEGESLSGLPGVYGLLQSRVTKKLTAAAGQDFERMKAEHIADYQALYNRVELCLTGDKREDVPTDERLRLLAEGGEDIALQELLFQYGRYLMIAGSRPGTLPLTLQGLWNQDFTPAWGAKYTININTEMNYWPAESCNLSECHLPLFTLLETMVPNGRKVAESMYGARGFVAHHNTDIKGDCAPQDLWFPATFWPMGAAWLCTHVWTHYLYTGDEEFLKKYFPVLLEAALFFVDFLTPYGDYLVTNPSSSPENVYILPGGERGAVCLGPTMDNQILRDLFEICIKACGVLGDAAYEVKVPGAESIPALIKDIKEKLAKLAPTRISSDGRIMEWMEEYEEEEPGHRHISQLYGLFPSEQITVDGTPELAEAAKETLKKRLSNGGGHTGWSRAWIMNHYAKLWDGEAAYENIVKMLTQSTYPNLFDKHPPFQIDGNFGATQAIAQMLVQCNEERIVLLPALPKAWNTGSVRGLCVAGGATVDLFWEEHELTECILHAKQPFRGVIQYKDDTFLVKMTNGEEKILKKSKKCTKDSTMWEEKQPKKQ